MFGNCLTGKTALITGAFGGLGKHFAYTLAKAGARVGLVGRRIADGEAMAAEMRASGMEAIAVRMDVLDPESVSEAVDTVTRALGPITILVNNAGIAVSKRFLDSTEEDWGTVIDVNLNGSWRVAQAVARHMREHREGGSIINIASIYGCRVANSVSGYAASKAALIQMSKAMALELAQFGIRVNALAPGYFETDLNGDFFASENGIAMIKRIPQRRLGTYENLDGPLLLLASDAGAYMTGSVLVVDGGHLVSSL